MCVFNIYYNNVYIKGFWTDIDSSFYIYFFTSIIVFPYSDKTFYLQNYFINYVHVITFCHLEVL